MEPFYCLSTRKKLPGKHGQQDLIAALDTSGETSKSFQNKYFQLGTAFALSLSNRGLGEPFRFEKWIRERAWEGNACGSFGGENHRWRIRFSSDYRGR